jgi:hypothetical protein
MFAAMRRASSRVISLAADRRPGLIRCAPGRSGQDRWAGAGSAFSLVVDSSDIRAKPLFEHTAFARVVFFDGSEPPFDEGVDGHAVMRLYVWAILKHEQQFLQRLDEVDQLFTFTHRLDPVLKKEPQAVLGTLGGSPEFLLQFRLLG